MAVTTIERNESSSHGRLEPSGKRDGGKPLIAHSISKRDLMIQTVLIAPLANLAAPPNLIDADSNPTLVVGNAPQV